MECSLKNKALALSLVLVVAIAALSLSFVYNSPKRAHSAGYFYNLSCDNNQVNANSGATTTLAASTSPTFAGKPLYLGSGASTGDTATSTLGPCNIGGATGFMLNMMSVATTTAAPTILYTLQYSFNCVDFYNENTNSQSGTIITENSTTTHSWATTVGTSTHQLLVNPATAKCVEINYSATATTSLYLQVANKNEIPN